MLSETAHSDESIEALRCMQEYWKDVINDNLVTECMGLAIRRNRPDIVRSFLITRGGPMRLRRKRFDDPFMIACKFGYAEVVRILLDADAIDTTGYADDHYDKAFAHGSITIMHMLFQRGLTSHDACTMANMVFRVLLREAPFEIRQDEEDIMRDAVHLVSGCNCNMCMSTKNLQSQMHALARHLM
jgi:ankyrin repeat protein